MLIARSASPAVFGALAALAGMALVFEVPANALQVALGRAVADGPDGRVAPVAAGTLLIDAVALGAGVCALLLACRQSSSGSCTCPRSRALSCSAPMRCRLG